MYVYFWCLIDAPKHRASEIIYLDTNESTLLNCTPEYANPKVENYIWSSKTTGYDIPKINGPFLLYNQSSETDEVKIQCFVFNSVGFSVTVFRIKQVKGKLIFKYSLNFIGVIYILYRTFTNQFF